MCPGVVFIIHLTLHASSTSTVSGQPQHHCCIKDYECRIPVHNCIAHFTEQHGEMRNEECFFPISCMANKQKVLNVTNQIAG